MAKLLLRRTYLSEILPRSILPTDICDITPNRVWKRLIKIKLQIFKLELKIEALLIM